MRHIEWHFVWDDIERIRRERCFDGDFCYIADMIFLRNGYKVTFKDADSD